MILDIVSVKLAQHEFSVQRKECKQSQLILPRQTKVLHGGATGVLSSQQQHGLKAV